MPWTDKSGPVPERSEQELYAAVQQRAAVIRRRRRAGLSAGVGAVAVLLVAFALVRTGDDRASELRVVGDMVTTTTSIVPVPTTVLVVPSTSTSVPVVPPPPDATSTTRPPTAVTSPPPTTLRPTPPTTAVPPTTSTSTTVPPPLRMCQPGEVVVTATPDRPSYPAGATVKIVVAAQNRSSLPCQPLDPSLEFRDGAGAYLGGMGIADVFTMGSVGQPPPSWDPGETLSTSMGWPPYCGGPGCPPGSYTVTAVFGPFRSAPAPFTLT